MLLASDHSHTLQGVASISPTPEVPTPQVLAPQSPVNTLDEGSPVTSVYTQSSGSVSTLHHPVLEKRKRCHPETCSHWLSRFQLAGRH